MSERTRSTAIIAFDPATIGLLLGGALAAGFVSGFAGFGTGLMASGFWYLALPAASVPPLIVLTSIVGQVLGLIRLRQSLDWRGVAPFLVGGLIGLPFGLMALHLASPSLLRGTVGFFLIAYAASQLSGLRNWSIGNWGGRIADAVVGSGGGFLGGFAGLSGPLPLVWLQLRGGPSAGQRMVYQPFNLVILSLAGALLLFTGRIDGAAASAALYCIPMTFVGTWIGLRLYSSAGEAGFKKVVLTLLLASGAILVWQSARAA